MNDEEIRRLLATKAESANLDFKEGFPWTKENRDKKYELARDLIAMANTKDGGRVVLGVRDSDFELIGVSEEIFESIDPNTVVQMVHDNAAPKVKCEVIKKIIDNLRIIVLDVAEFEETPIVCTNSILSTDGRRQILREGAIYIRTIAATTEEISSPDDMRSLIGRAITRKGDELLQTIQQLLTGKPIRPGETDEQFYAREKDAGLKFFDEQLSQEFRNQGYIELVAHPTAYVSDRIKTLPEARGLVLKSEVALRGWDFPHTDKKTASPFANGVQSITLWGQYREAYRLYRSGLFLWRGAYWEDADNRRSKSGGRLLSFVALIYAFTEYLIFLKRLYEQISPDATIYFKISLYGCKDRELASLDPMIAWWGGYVSTEDVISQEVSIRVAELRASNLEIAAKLVRHVFHVFNWLDVAEGVIEQWQQKLLQKKF